MGGPSSHFLKSPPEISCMNSTKAAKIKRQSFPSSALGAHEVLCLHQGGS